MFCKSCGTFLDKEDIFCAGCGKKVHIDLPGQSSTFPAGQNITFPARPEQQIPYPASPVNGILGRDRSRLKIFAVCAAALIIAGGGFLTWRFFSEPPALEQSYIYYAANRYDLAISGFQAALKNGYADARVLEALADCYLRIGDEGTALDVLNQLLQIDDTENTRLLIEKLTSIK